MECQRTSFSFITGNVIKFSPLGGFYLKTMNIDENVATPLQEVATEWFFTMAGFMLSGDTTQFYLKTNNCFAKCGNTILQQDVGDKLK